MTCNTVALNAVVTCATAVRLNPYTLGEPVMSVQRGLVPPALIASTIIVVVCVASWGALGVISLVDADDLSPAAQRYVCTLLVTVTTCAVMTNLAARTVRAVRTPAQTADAYAAGYADGYTDGVDARPGAAPPVPAVSRLVRLGR